VEYDPGLPFLLYLFNGVLAVSNGNVYSPEGDRIHAAVERRDSAGLYPSRMAESKYHAGADGCPDSGFRGGPGACGVDIQARRAKVGGRDNAATTQDVYSFLHKYSLFHVWVFVFYVSLR